MFSEQDVDRELQAALSVSPSPEFEARVLQRVAADRPVLVGVFGVARGLKTAGLLVAASIVIVAGLFYALNRTPVVIAPPAAPPVAAHAAPPAPKTAPVFVSPKQIDPRVQSVLARHRPPRAARPEGIVPEVIVVNQMEAVRRLVRAVNEGRIDAPETPLEAPVVAVATKLVPKEVAVAPLVVDPIPVPALEPDADAPSPIIRGQK